MCAENEHLISETRGRLLPRVVVSKWLCSLTVSKLTCFNAVRLWFASCWKEKITGNRFSLNCTKQVWGLCCCWFCAVAKGNPSPVAGVCHCVTWEREAHTVWRICKWSVCCIPSPSILLTISHSQSPYALLVWLGEIRKEVTYLIPLPRYLKANKILYKELRCGSVAGRVHYITGQIPKFNLHKFGVVVHTCQAVTGKMKAERSGVQVILILCYTESFRLAWATWNKSKKWWFFFFIRKYLNHLLEQQSSLCSANHSFSGYVFKMPVTFISFPS